MPNHDLLDTRYRVLRTIGSGGMGVVYLVIDSHKENKIMALKTCSAGGDPVVAEGFRSEFRNVLGVQHPHIPEVYDFGTLSAQVSSLYFTCEFIDGQPLDSLQAQWSPDQLRFILVSLCRALSFLHSRSLLHRDIKPDNVLGKLNDDGTFALLKLVDFGLAAKAHETQDGVSGTLDYLAPEVIQGDMPTAVADIYSLGLLLYRLAAGRLPFTENDPVAASKKRAKNEIPSLLRYRAAFPVGLSDVISAMLCRKPEDRPASARHVIALLNEREGLDFPYETPETSRAYVRSASAVTNAGARRLLKGKTEALGLDHDPQQVFIRSRPGLGRNRLFQDFISELTLAGISNQNIYSAKDFPAGDKCPSVLIIPKVEQVDAESLCKALENSGECRPWFIIGGREIPPELESSLERFQLVTLQPLDGAGVQSFIQETFPENSFPGSFQDRIYSESVGVPSALQMSLDRLQETELIRIGLTGWELMPGDWMLVTHDDVRWLVLDEYQELSSRARAMLNALACSPTPVPEAILNAVVAAGSSADDGRSLDQSSWITGESEARKIRFAAVRKVIAEELDEDTTRAIHQSLRAAWESDTDASPALRQREILYHDFKSNRWLTPVEDARRILEEAIAHDKLFWTRDLLLWCETNNPPAQLRPMIWELLSKVEYIEGNLSRSAELLGELLDAERAEVTPENLRLMARYASFKEKLGHTDISERILNRGLQVLSSEQQDCAGAIYGTLAWIAFKKGEQERARTLAEEGLSRVPPNTVDPGFALLLNTFATLAFYRGDGEVAGLYWKRCLEASTELGDRKGIANMYNNLGVLAATSGDRIRARSLWEQCAEIAAEINDTHRLAGNYNNLGIDSLETGSMRDAEEYYLKALTLFRRMQSPREQVEILSNLGELSYYRADYPRAQAYFREAIELATRLGDRESQIEPMVYLGKLLITLEHLDTAESVLTDAQAIAHETGVRKGEGQALEGLAAIHARNGDRDQAGEMLKNAHTLLPGEADPLALIHLNLTECMLGAEAGNRQAAVSALDCARQVADIKWDPYTAARTEVYGLLFANEEMDEKRKQFALRKLYVFPNLLWGFYWAEARRLVTSGSIKKALEEFGKGVAVLKAISARLSDVDRKSYLSSPLIRKFKDEALQARSAIAS